MSATFKNAKKKLSQTELRRFMNEHKGKQQKPVKKIDSPLAKYNDAGQLTCILCQSIVRSEAVWQVHINSKQHRDNVEHAKKLKEKTNNFTTPLKRPLTPPFDVPTKKVKGILKNAPSTTEKPEGTIPDDCLDSNKPIEISPDIQSVSKEVISETEILPVADVSLPEGFFDDPRQDAKARNVEYRNPIEEEWERFQKEIREADSHSAAIIAEDQEEATTERQIDEIDEQMKNLSRVINLEKKKMEIVTTSSLDEPREDSEDFVNENEIDFDEYLDWRAKQSFK